MKLYTFIIEYKENSRAKGYCTDIVQIRAPNELIAAQLIIPGLSSWPGRDEPTPINGAINVWCVTGLFGHRKGGWFIIATIIETSA